MTEWREASIDELCVRVTSGGTPSRKHPEYYSNAAAGIPWVKSQELVGRTIMRTEEHITDSGLRGSSAKLLPPHTVLMAMYGANVGQLGYLGIEATVNQAICAMVTDPAVTDARFLYYALVDARQDLIGQAHGAAQQNLSQQLIKPFRLRVPCLPIQRRIGGILGRIDELIENNRRRAEALEEMARAVYREWFVRFRFPGHENVELVDSAAGPMPNGWQVTPISSVASIDKGLSYKGAYLTGTGTPMANLKCFAPGGGFRRDGTKPYSGPFKSKHAVRYGDLVLANTDLTQAGAVIGSPALIPRRGFEEGGIISHHLFAVRVVDPTLTLFLYHEFGGAAFRGYARGVASGTTVLGFRPADVLSYSFVLPPAELRARFAALVSDMRQTAEALEDSTDTLGTIRDLLLPKLVTGEIDVSSLDLDALVEGAVA